MEFEGQVALVTGAASGIGKASALMLAESGADVAIADINAEQLADTAREIEALGRQVLSITLDVTDGQACQQAVADTIAKLGRLDVLCNIAGIAKMSHLADITHDAWRTMVDINLNSVFYLSQAAMPELLKNGGNIVNMSSTAGIEGQAYNSSYCATKGAVALLTKSMAMEFGSQGVRVNALCPGGVKTALTDKFTFPEGADMGLIGKLMSLVDMATADEIARVVVFLASKESRFINGVVMPVDGGQTVG